LLCIAAVANLIHPMEPTAPPGWEGINTHFGSIAQEVADPLAVYRVAEEIQREALSAQASVIVFPETVVPYWTASTDAFWQQTLAELKAGGKTVLVGARISREQLDSRRLYDFSAELATLGSTQSPVPAGPSRSTQWSPAYFNAIVIRGAQEATFEQRIPVPMAMWNPFKSESAPLNLEGPAVLRIGSKRAAILICYEQLIVWPLVTAMLENPDVLVGAANDYWAFDTTIPRFQRSAVQSWARLFGISYVLAVNR
jgi:apolipoprotein N-acyltransferase